jgi:hypothetical protein
MKAELGEGGGKILLDDKTGVGAVELRPIRFQCIGVWISVGLSCTVEHILSSDLHRTFRKVTTALSQGVSLSKMSKAADAGKHCTFTV